MFSERRKNSLRRVRTKQRWPKDKPFKILSLDGGGIRGIYASQILKLCEQEFGVARDHFDLISGTSTGGIIGIGLGLGISAAQINQLYQIDGGDIFPPSIFHSKRLMFLAPLKRLIRPSHDHEMLEKHLREQFSDRKLGESAARLVIPAFLGPDPQVALFKTDHHADYRRDWETPAWKVARATSAAPTFFPAHQEKDAFYLDGGVWANNPSLCAITEALSAYDVSRDQVQVLSIGTGTSAERLNESLVRAGMLGWRSIINTAMFLSSDSALSQSRLLLGYENILRLDPTNFEHDPIELDDWPTAVEVLPDLAVKTFEQSRDEIGAFFGERVLDRERHYSS